MQAEKGKKSTKTFPLEIEGDLHKALKLRAIEEVKMLHSLIIDALSAKVREEPASYRLKASRGRKQ